MRVIRPEVLGMCFGVRDALAVLDSIDDPGSVTIHGDLVHNEAVLHQLDARGFARRSEADREALPATPVVLITAHGVSDSERARLESAGKRLIDTTCPLVTRAHQAALVLRDLGYFVLVIGKPGHVEVLGLTGDLDRFEVVASADHVRTYEADRLGIVCQTTATQATVKTVVEAIERANPHAEVRFVDTVCRPTKDHQRALDRLLERVDAVVVVGGKTSNNTKELVATCRARGVPTVHVQGPGDLDPDWFDGFETIGLTAGTSTLDSTIDAVQEEIEAIARNLSEWNDAAPVGFGAREGSR